MQGFDALALQICKSCPNTKIIIAHMGGHHVIDFVMLAKRIPNLFSTSLAFYIIAVVQSRYDLWNEKHEIQSNFLRFRLSR